MDRSGKLLSRSNLYNLTGPEPILKEGGGVRQTLANFGKLIPKFSSLPKKVFAKVCQSLPKFAKVCQKILKILQN